MKKVYTKPEIMFDNFSLTTNIASVCEVKIEGPTQGTCGLRWGATTIFVEKASGCAKQVKDGEGYNGLCYHVPNQAYNVFNS